MFESLIYFTLSSVVRTVSVALEKVSLLIKFPCRTIILLSVPPKASTSSRQPLSNKHKNGVTYHSETVVAMTYLADSSLGLTAGWFAWRTEYGISIHK